MKAIKSIKDLPERVQGNGLRADEYTAYSNHVTVAVLNDAEFNKVIEHNTRVNDDSKQYDVLTISNERDYVIIRESAFTTTPPQQTVSAPERTAKAEADRLAMKPLPIMWYNEVIEALKSANVSIVWHEEVLTILKGM